MAKHQTKTSAYRIALDLRFSGSSQIYYSGVFASLRRLEAALAEQFAEGQDTTCLLDAWPLDLCVLEHYRGGVMQARVDLSRNLRARLSNGRRIDLGAKDLVIEGIPDRHDEDHDAYLELLDALAAGDLRLELSIQWTGLKLGKQGPPLGSRAKSLRLANGFEHPRGWIGGDDAWDLRDELDPID